MRDLWYKDAVIYCLDVETFQDSDGDGIGDFAGLCNRLDYVASLGATCLWLLPFFPSPNRDNGYDVTDYYGVDSRLGTLGDFVEFMHQARERGLRVIIDLVVNHTSDQHPWFLAAADESSPYHDFYVWSKEKPEDAHEGMVFPGKVHTTWTYHRKVKKYYFHRFYEHQPELNIANPDVRREIKKIIGFWLALDVSGFRLDAAPFLIELKGIPNTDQLDPYNYLREFRHALSWRRGDSILLAEANVPNDLVDEYLGDGDKLQMLFNFLLNQAMFLALARQDAGPLERALCAAPKIPPTGQWANFLRNHDELDLGRLTEEERQFVFSQFAPDENMQLYDRGIRRRLAPMLGGDQRRIRLAYSLMFTMPGTPIMRYGEEIGMGDDLSLEERNSVRTVMQWSSQSGSGFSSAPKKEFVRPVIDNGPFGSEKVSVEQQRRDPDSLLQWMQRMIRAWRECPEFGWGELTLIGCGDSAVLAHCCQWEENATVAVHNLSDQKRTVHLDLSKFKPTRLVDVLSDQQHQPVNGLKHSLDVEPYGYRWLRMEWDK